MAEKVTTMVIKVDLQCEKCHKKIKKVLCKIPQIQNQIYDLKAGTVTITVVCCSPEKIKKKICCKGGEAVKGIEIKVPEKPKPKEPEKPKEKPKEPEKPKEKPKEPEPAPKPAPKPAPPPKAPEQVPVCRPVPVYPRTCCNECYQGFDGGPCYHGHGIPAPPCYEAYGRPVYDSWGGGCSCQRNGYYVCRCKFVYDDNPSSCTII